MGDYRRGKDASATGIGRQIAAENRSARCKICGYSTCRCEPAQPDKLVVTQEARRFAADAFRAHGISPRMALELEAGEHDDWEGVQAFQRAMNQTRADEREGALALVDAKYRELTNGYSKPASKVAMVVFDLSRAIRERTT